MEDPLAMDVEGASQTSLNQQMDELMASLPPESTSNYVAYSVE